VKRAAEARFNKDSGCNVDRPRQAGIAKARVASRVEASPKVRSRDEVAEQICSREWLAEENLAGDVARAFLWAPGVLGGTADP
jgi:hypothetical protein